MFAGSVDDSLKCPYAAKLTHIFAKLCEELTSYLL